LQERLGVSLGTLKRDIAYMRDRLHAPIVFDRDLGGYRFERDGKRVGPQYELPGLWFSAEEIHALLTMQHLLANLDSGGLLGPQIQPLLARLSGLLGSADNPAEEVQKRIRIETVGARRFHLSHFQAVGSAMLRRKRLLIRYHARGTDEVTEREVSPQRLVHYRDNWYLDAWCHLREGLRAFSADAIEQAEILDKRAKEVPRSASTKCWARATASSRATKSPGPRCASRRSGRAGSPPSAGTRSRRAGARGRLRAAVPYTDDRELLMDILKYGGDCRGHRAGAGAVGARSGCRRLRRGSPGCSPIRQRSRPVPPGLDQQKIRQTGFTGSPCEPDE
jgi:predicted DNA-binding transcriptional regulator YafY